METELDEELTISIIFEEISEKVAQARTKALMGEREEALGILRGASLEYSRFRDVLADYPGHLALEHAFTATMHTLCGEDNEIADAMREAGPAVVTRGGRGRKKAAQAA